MAREKGKAKTTKRGGWLKKFFTLTILVCVVGLPILAHINSRIVTLKYEKVYLQDLPEEFDGVTALFVSDIHIMGLNTPGCAIALMNSLQNLKPDFLFLGGDYTSQSLVQSLRKTDTNAEMVQKRAEFFAALADFEAPLGKFAIVGNHDADTAQLRNDCRLGGIDLLVNSAAKISKGDASLYVIGLDEFTNGEKRIQELAKTVRGEDCAIVLSHEPDAFPAIAASEAADGGKWADLILAGHMHGGQVNLFGWTPVLPSSHGDQYITGWIRENDHWMLVSNGVGCSMLNVRWGAPAQAHLITFRKAD